MSQYDFYVIAGPTGSGKTRASLGLDPDRFEIIGCDSRQVYQGMEIGTAAPSLEEREWINHHLVSYLPPDQEINAALYAREAEKAIVQIRSRGKIPVVVGGTGFYLRALATEISEVPSDPRIREELNRLTLEEKLKTIQERDPDSLQRPGETVPGKIHPNDEYRITRALEAILITGKKWSETWQVSRASEKRRFQYVGFFLEPEMEGYRRGLEERIVRMVGMGFVQEAVRIRERYGAHCQGLKSLGYLEALQVADGTMGEGELVQVLVGLHYRYGKKQLTWFRGDGSLVSLDPKNLEGPGVSVTDFFPDLDKNIYDGE